MSPNLTGKVCLVTGATKGIGRGIALQLGSAGAKVYITGRTPELLTKCAEEINSRGGKAVALKVDHSSDKEVADLFVKINQDESGKLDVLVNNAYTGVNTIFSSAGKKFWETDATSTWDSINGTGLRGHYLCTVHAAKIMTQNQQGLIVNISSGGGLKYLFNVAYGVGKAACDRMAADCAHELRSKKVAMVSLWPGPVKTEFIQEKVIVKGNPLASSFAGGESIEFAGKAVANLAADPNYMAKTGRILMTGDLAREYNFVDEDGEQHDVRSVSYWLKRTGHTWLAALVPSFIRVPLFVVHLFGNKF